MNLLGFKKGKNSRNDGIKETFFQSSTMGEFVSLRSREKQATMVQHKKVTELRKINFPKVSTCEVADGKEKKMFRMQKRPQKVLPGSVVLYLQM